MQEKTNQIHQDTKLFLISFALLFIELMCIRWLSTEIRIFAYFQNFVLIGCFLGFGIGCSLPRLRIPIVTTVLLLAVFTIFTGYMHLFDSGSQILGMFHDYVIVQTQEQSVPILDAVRHFIIIGIMFSLLVFMFIPVGCILGRYLENHPRPLRAYSINVIGSIIGVWIYTLVCFISTPPVVWFFISFLTLGVFLWEDRRWIGIAGLGILICLLFAWPKLDPEQKIWWSPYQKLVLNPIYMDVDAAGNLQPTTGKTERRIKYGYNLTANQAHIQFLEDLNIYPRFYGPIHRYNISFQFTPRLENVLILGSGCGNDVAEALKSTAQNIDAVEIDPLIVQIGREFHPNKPYGNDSRVNVIVDDARSFLKKTKTKYDLICFSLLDAHTVGSGFTNIRLDDYVYTVEAFRDARKCLKPDGLVSMRFYTEKPFTASRLYKNMRVAFEQDPYVFWLEGMYGVCGDPETIDQYVVHNENPDVRARVRDQQRAIDFLSQSPLTPISTDDWPYLYLTHYRIPMSYLFMIAVLLTTTIIIIKTCTGQALRLNTHFFFLGAAFLLIETQSISKLSLLFGNTWIVNSIVISVILMLVLLANGLIMKFKLQRSVVIYPFLAVSVFISYLLPLDILLGFAPLLRGLAGALILCLPLFCASMIFSISFSQSKNLNAAFGSNMIGTLLGGLCSCLSFIIGISGLSLIGLTFYAITFLTRDRI